MRAPSLTAGGSDGVLSAMSMRTGESRMIGLGFAVAAASCGAPGARAVQTESPALAVAREAGTQSPASPALALPSSACATTYLECNVPFQKWSPLAAKAIGLLVARNAAWGPVVDHTRGGSEGQSMYAFYAQGNSPRAIYFEAKSNEGLHFISHWKVPTLQGTTYFDAAMHSPQTGKKWGLTKSTHLVEAEVNRGQGGGGIHFVVTAVRVLDGTPEFPLDPDHVLVARRKEYDEHVRSQGLALEKELARVRKKPTGTVEDLTDEQPRTRAFVTWLGESERLVVFFETRFERRWTEVVRRESRMPCPPGAPCAQPPADVLARDGYGVEVGATYQMDKTGKVVDATFLPPRALAPTRPSTG